MLNIELYRQIFNNVFISKIVFTQVHEIQKNSNSCKYNQIDDVAWMTKNGHHRLLEEKLKFDNRNSNTKTSTNTTTKLYISNPEDIFSLNNVDLFIKIFEIFRYKLLHYYSSDFIQYSIV